MSLRTNFRIRSRESSYATSKGNSILPDQDNWFDQLKQKKLRCRKTLDDSYGNISLQQTQLRSAIRGASADRLHLEKENTLANLNSQNSLHEPHDHDKSRKQISKDLKMAVRALTHLQGEFVPSRVDNFHLNQQLVRKDNDTLWNKLAHNPRQQQLLLYQSHSANIGGRANCCFKITKMHRKYILKVIVTEGKFGVVLHKDKWEALWKEHPSFEEIASCLSCGQDGKLLVASSVVQPTTNMYDGLNSHTSSHQLNEPDSK